MVKEASVSEELVIVAKVVTQDQTEPHSFIAKSIDVMF
jgi:hypothetical protein